MNFGFLEKFPRGHLGFSIVIDIRHSKAKTFKPVIVFWTVAGLKILEGLSKPRARVVLEWMIPREVGSYIK